MTELRLSDLLGSLLDDHVAFLVFGAVAMAFYGHVRATQDLDIVLEPSAANRRRLTEWLQRHEARLALNPDRAFGADEAAAVQGGSNATVLTDLGQVDVVQRLPGLAPFSSLLADAERYVLEDRTVLVVDRATLMRRKAARATAQDVADVEALRTLLD